MNTSRDDSPLLANAAPQIAIDSPPPSSQRETSRRQRIGLPMVVSAAVHAALLIGALLIEPSPATAAKEEPAVGVAVMARLVGGPAAAGGGSAEPAAPAASKIERRTKPKGAAHRAARPKQKVRQEKKRVAVSPTPPPEQAPAPKLEEEPLEEAVEETLVAEDTERATDDRLPPEEGDEPVLLADASHALGRSGGHAGRGAGYGRGMGRGAGTGSGGLVGDGFGAGPVDGATAAVPPKLREQVQPQYPSVARRRGIQGMVVLHLIVDKDGKVEPESTKVLESVPGLDRAAIAAVNRWRFSPARDRSGAPLRAFLRVPLNFTLQ